MREYSLRINVIVVVFLAAAAVLVTRLTFIQIVKKNEYTALSETQSVEREIVSAPRGRILDRYGEVLAKPIDGEFTFSHSTINDNIATLKTAGDHTLGSPSRKYSRRVYPLQGNAGSLLGYVGRDGYGLGGLEYAMDSYLRGENGWKILRRDARKNRYNSVAAPHRLPRTGSDVYTTIQSEIQRIVHNVLREAVEKCGAKGAMCVVMDPATGDVLAMAELPVFNPNSAMHYPRRIRQCQNVSYNYEPGSTFKVITAAVALQTANATVDEMIDGNQGKYRIYNDVITDRKPFGMLSFTDALAVSCNVCFAKIGHRLGNETFYRYIREFGFGAKTGIQLPGEEKGQLKPVDKWSGRTGVTFSIGQGLSVTPIQMMSAFSCVANGGLLVKPNIIHKVEDVDGRTVHAPETTRLRRVISKETAMKVRMMMRDVVREGTGTQAAIRDVPVAGKTGTSQKYDAEEGTYSNTRCWSSFIGFAPVIKPRLVCGVIIDEPANAEGGGTVAAPAFREIMEQIISNPQLQYAQLLLNATKDSVGMRGSSGKKHSRDSSAAFALMRHMYKKHQSDGKKVQQVVAQRSRETSAVEMPDCIGKSTRESVNEISMRGCIPVVVGAGSRILAQYPPPGDVTQKAAVCTLYCARKRM